MKRWLVVLIAVLFACGDKRSTTEPEVPTVASVTVAPDAHAVPDGSTVQITATLYDRNGQVFTSPPPGVSIAWSSADDAIASVSGNGLVTGNRPGETRITATAAGRSATATIEVTQVPTALVAVSGSGQEEAIGAELPEPLVVRVEDRHGDPVAGVAVTWSVSSGGGSLEPASGTTDDSGEASAVWTLGVESGEQSVRVTADEIADAYAEFVALSENQAPVATITTPTNGAIFSPGATIEFTGSAVDPEDGALTGDALIWSIGGKQLGKGESFSTDELEVGMHLVTLTATDSHGASGTAEVQIKVEAAALVCSNVVTLGEGATMAGELPSVVVTGKVTVTGETKVCGSLRIVGYGDLTIGANTVEVADTLSVGHKLNMQDAAGLVRVGGNATFHSSYTTGLLTAGTIEVGGDISMGGYYSPLDASGTHTVVLNGSGPQSVTNSHGASLVGDGSRFNNLRIENPNTITFGNIAVRGSLEVAAPATLTGEGTLIVGGELKSAAGSKIEVERLRIAGGMDIDGAFSSDTVWFDGAGRVMQGGLDYNHVIVRGEVNLAGDARVAGDFRVIGQSGSVGQFDISDHTLEVAGGFWTEQIGRLRMTEASGMLRIGGNAYFGGANSTELSAGTIEVAGDLRIQRGHTGCCTTFHRSFDASGTHTVVLNGTGPQEVSFSHASLAGDNLRINDLRIENPGAITIGLAAVRGTVDVAVPATLTGEGTLIVGGELKSVAGSRIEVERVTMAGAMSISGAFSPDTIWFDGAGREIQGGLDYGSIVVRGSAVLGGDVEARGNVLVTGIDGLLDIGAQTLEVAGEFRTEQIGRLRMTDPAGVLSIGGDAWFGGGNSNELSAGTIEVLGNFTQRRGSSGCCTGFDESFRASGSHLVILKGTAPQVVDFNRGGLELTRSHFSGLQITNPAGVTVEGTIAVRGQLDLSGQLTVPAEATLSIGSMLILGPTAVLHNQGTVTVPACTVEPGGTVTGVAQCGS